MKYGKTRNVDTSAALKLGPHDVAVLVLIKWHNFSDLVPRYPISTLSLWPGLQPSLQMEDQPRELF